MHKIANDYRNRFQISGHSPIEDQELNHIEQINTDQQLENLDRRRDIKYFDKNQSSDEDEMRNNFTNQNEECKEKISRINKNNSNNSIEDQIEFINFEERIRELENKVSQKNNNECEEMRVKIKSMEDSNNNNERLIGEIKRFKEDILDQISTKMKNVTKDFDELIEAKMNALATYLENKIKNKCSLIQNNTNELKNIIKEVLVVEISNKIEQAVEKINKELEVAREASKPNVSLLNAELEKQFNDLRKDQQIRLNDIANRFDQQVHKHIEENKEKLVRKEDIRSHSESDIDHEKEQRLREIYRCYY